MMQVIMGITEGFSIPTATLSLLIVEKGNIPLPHILEQKFKLWSLKPWSWNSAVKTEAYYPFPALLLAILSITTQIPIWLVVLLPINGVARVLIIYAIVSSLLLTKKDKKGALFVISFSIYAVYIVLSRYAVHTIGRGILGVTLVGLFIYVVIFQALTINSRFKSAVLIALFSIAAIFTYYTAVTAILSISFFAIISFLRRGSANAVLTIVIPLVISLAGVLYTHIYNIAMTMTRHYNFTFYNILKHMLDSVLSSLGLLKGESYIRYYSYLFDDPIYRLLHSFELTLKVLIIIAVLASALLFVARLISGKGLNVSDMHYLFFAFLLVSSELGEIPYLLVTPTVPTRFILFYGSITIVYLITKLYKLYSATHKHRYKYSNRSLFILIIILLQLLLIAASSFWLYKDLTYGHTYTTPFSYHRAMLDGLFIARFYPIGEKLRILSDVSYSSYIFLSLLRYDNTMAFFSQIYIGPFIDLLSHARKDNPVNLKNFEEELKRRGVNGIVIPIFKRVIGGDIWGWNAKPSELMHLVVHSSENLSTHFSIIYSSSYSIYVHSLTS